MIIFTFYPNLNINLRLKLEATSTRKLNWINILV